MRKIACTALAGLLVCGALSGCSQTGADDTVKEAKTWEYTKATQLVYDCLGGTNDVMPLLGFWSAPDDATLKGQYFPNMKNDEYFAAVKESGVNLLLQTNDDVIYDDAVVEQTLTYCDTYGLGYYVSDMDLYSSGSFIGRPETLTESILEYSKHKSFAGLYVRDEPIPGTEGIMNRSARAFYEAADELSLNIHPYLTLFPYWYSGFNPDPWVAYTEHMEKIYTDSGMNYVQYDIYPLKQEIFEYEWYYSNLSLVKKFADEKGISWIPFVSVSGEGNYRLPKEGELSWQINQYLAFGAKGISYFPINSPISYSDYVEKGEIVAMFDYFGNKTEVYYYVKEANKQIVAVDEYLMNATNHGVVVNGELQGKQYLSNNEIIEEAKFRELTGVSGDHAIVGCFDYFGKTCLYAVNGSMYEEASVTLDFDDRYAYDVIQRGQKAGVKGKKIELSLAAGEAAFIILK